MSTIPFFSALSPTTTASATQTDMSNTSAEPSNQGFAGVYGEQSSYMDASSNQETADGTESLAQAMVVSEASEEGELLPYGLPLNGQAVSAENSSIPALAHLVMEQDTTPVDGDETSTALSYTQSFDDQGQPLPNMTVPVIEQSENAEGDEFNEFDHLMQQRSLNPSIQKNENQTQAQAINVNPQAQAANASVAMPALNERVVKADMQSAVTNIQDTTSPVLDSMDPVLSDELTAPLTTRPNSLGPVISEMTQTTPVEIDQVPLDADITLKTDLDLKATTSTIFNDSQTNKAAALASAEEKVKASEAQNEFKIDVSPKDNRWTEKIAERIAIMNTDSQQSARIQLDPPELGLLEIKIRVQQDQVSVAFNSGHAAVREALDSQSGRLKELLEQQGINLSDVSVSDQGQQSTAQGQEQQGEEGQSAEGNASSGLFAGTDGAEDEGQVIQTQLTNHLVDEIA